MHETMVRHGWAVHVIRCVGLVVRSYDLALHTHDTQPIRQGANHAHEYPIVNSRNRLPHTTPHRSSPGNQALRSISAENGATEIAAGIPFPHARQMLQLTRTVTHRKTGARHTEVVYAVTSLARDRFSVRP